jgi:hypothetical protein
MLGDAWKQMAIVACVVGIWSAQCFRGHVSGPQMTALVIDQHAVASDVTYETRFVTTAALGQIALTGTAGALSAGVLAGLVRRRARPAGLAVLLTRLLLAPFLVVLSLIVMLAAPTAKERIDIAATRGEITLAWVPLVGRSVMTVVPTRDVTGVEWSVRERRRSGNFSRGTDRFVLRMSDGHAIASYGASADGSLQAARQIASMLSVPLRCTSIEIVRPGGVFREIAQDLPDCVNPF